MEKEFKNIEQFREWLANNVTKGNGIWIRFYKDKITETISAEEALDVSLWFGWIDGQMKSEGDRSYLKYFSPRTKNSKWSEKNKIAIERLRSQNLMTSYGEQEVAKAKENGQWNKIVKNFDFDNMIEDFTLLIDDDTAILEKFTKCSFSMKKRYVGFYFDAKTEETKRKRLEKIKTAINDGEKGMLY